jgi:hypothetical protein
MAPFTRLRRLQFGRGNAAAKFMLAVGRKSRAAGGMSRSGHRDAPFQ